ncbi:MAG: hypothetical protein A2677_02040 [Candidatus Komeilibacteria bacterium RIFCSPHIGHO2_01_FULL_52_14]|uniref:Dockerin domain-containing protein n=1 Tax=Candidatus Komeilibacteria bacterium RIFCSPHIGHO2_01_FULL_52_14 TaxID=1798549 RepID=A0A1G2BI98_9BACT|nr:MAG: hypothetical protein A2677_02040 [Candidatus Komeilibacteria bacterium RIFCSPHIGHO2_01_FULL_52_14]
MVLRDGVIAARTTADAQANFTSTLSGLSSGVYSFGFYAEDTQGIRTYTLSYVQTITGGIAWTVDGIFLSPSMGVSHVLIRQGETIQLFGITVPGSVVSVYINSLQEFTENVTALATGAWFKDFNTDVLEIGPHSSRSQAQQKQLLSPLSAAVEFHVGDRSVRAPTGGRTITGDLNEDGRINIVDFSILLFYWNQTNPKNAGADINGSGRVDLTDFSILLYHWTG